ncbi:MAG: hypothetical protein ACRBF0_17990 [Calditrichia bacterium]
MKTKENTIKRFTVFFALLLPALLFSQQSATSLEQELYKSALLQIEKDLLLTPSSDSLILGLKDDAAELAKAENWSDALELVALLQEMLNAVEFSEPILETSAIITTDISLIPERHRFSIESGIDFSQQKFGISPIESDTSIVEELQNPFFAVSYTQPIKLSESILKLRHDFRIDNQFMNYGLNANWEKSSATLKGRLEGSVDYHYSQTKDFASFLDARFRFNLGNANRSAWRWSVDGETTLKDFSKQDSLAADVFSGNLSLYLERLWGTAHSLLFRISPGFYTLDNSQGQFSQNQSMASYRYQKMLNKRIEVSFASVYQDYEYTLEPILERDAVELYKNSYVTLEPRAELEWVFGEHTGIELEVENERLLFNDNNAITPNEQMLSAKILPKFYFNSLNSIGIGYRGSSKTHTTEDAQEEDFARESDVYSNGIVISFDYLTLGGVFINLEYEALWRRYPNTTETTFTTFYSDRFVNLISLIAWLPINDHWRIQAFANFEDEQDQRFEVNDTQSTILSASLMYSF